MGIRHGSAGIFACPVAALGAYESAFSAGLVGRGEPHGPTYRRDAGVDMSRVVASAKARSAVRSSTYLPDGSRNTILPRPLGRRPVPRRRVERGLPSRAPNALQFPACCSNAARTARNEPVARAPQKNTVCFEPLIQHPLWNSAAENRLSVS
jgi:hypothetical protein